jgi:hypothetical protein
MEEERQEGTDSIFMSTPADDVCEVPPFFFGLDLLRQRRRD